MDPKAGLCGLSAGQAMTIGDAKCVEMRKVFEGEMYVQSWKVMDHLLDQR